MRKPDPALHHRRVTEIIDAAGECFLEQGFHAASVQTIAARAGISMGLLYRYFPNKDAIIAAVAEATRAEILVEIDRFGQADDPDAAIRQLLQSLLMSATEPGFQALTFEVLAESCRTPSIAKMVAADMQATRAALTAAFVRQQETGRIAKMQDAETLARMLLAGIDGLASQFHLDPADPALRERSIDLLAAIVVPEGPQNSA